MPNSNLSPEERELLLYFATARAGSSRLGFYLSVLAAPIAFAIYGVIQRDFVALAVAFFGLLAFVAWVVSSDRKHAKLLQSIASKITASEGEGSR